MQLDHLAGDVREEHRNVAADDVGLRRTHALVGHRKDLEAAGELLEHLAGDVADRADARMRIAELAGIGLGVGDQIHERVRGHAG